MNTTRIMICAVIALAGLSSACSTRKVVYKEGSSGPVVVQEEPGHGPPPHAPAHGYRAKHDDAVLVYDSHLDVYVVSGHRDCYYSAGQYFRFVDGNWEWSVSVSTGWKIVASYNDVPSSLCAKYGKGKKHKKNKHHGNDQGEDD
jgi:hypothetical protein